MNWGSFRQKYIQFATSRWQRVGLVLMYVFMIVIPVYHEIIAEIPPANELRKTNGELFLGPYVRGGNMTGLRTPQGKIFFTCGDTLIDKNLCLRQKDRLKLEGKEVSITWFSQNAYLGYHRNRLVELSCEGKKFISREYTERRMRTGKRLVWPLAVFVLIGFIGIDVYYTKYFNRRKKHES
ncbi:MAG: hypothetical protein ABFD75_13315 [Smithella sp.]